MASRINQSLSFHASPESFISSRLQQLALQDPEVDTLHARNETILQASILNRNVHIISSYRICQAILNNAVAGSDSQGCPVLRTLTRSAASKSSVDGSEEDSPCFTAEPAYAQFMSAFFPGPNILLKDGSIHTAHKAKWKHLLEDLPSSSTDLIQRLIQERFLLPDIDSASSEGQVKVDLYDTMKSLAWDILFGIFLNLDRKNETPEFEEMERLQENLLRGQFSLFPVSVWTPFWSSARSKGLKAVQEIKRRLRERVRADQDGDLQHKSFPYFESLKAWDWDEPNSTQSEVKGERDEDVVSHTLLFTSSIANKALASLLTAYLLNLFLWRSNEDKHELGANLAELIRSQQELVTRNRMLKSILSETERLSPPVVGVMRRVEKDIMVSSQQVHNVAGSSDHKIAARHDAWLYLAGASRDAAVFDRPNEFVWDRYMHMGSDADNTQSPLAFGGGPKTCLGSELARQICLTVADHILMDSRIQIRGNIAEQGVRSWLGWEQNVSLHEVAKDLKQLPCQRPRQPIIVKISV